MPSQVERLAALTDEHSQIMLIPDNGCIWVNLQNELMQRMSISEYQAFRSAVHRTHLVKILPQHVTQVELYIGLSTRKRVPATSTTLGQIRRYIEIYPQDPVQPSRIYTKRSGLLFTICRSKDTYLLVDARYMPFLPDKQLYTAPQLNSIHHCTNNGTKNSIVLAEPAPPYVLEDLRTLQT